MLLHSKLSKPRSDFNVTKCDRRRCTHCSTIKEPNLFTSTTPSSVHNINIDLSCTSTYVIYLIFCKKCKAQYVGQTHLKCTNPMNSHKYDFAHF